MFWFVGRVVDILDTIEPGAGWSGLLAAHGREIALMVLVVGLGRFAIAFLTALVDQQIITPGFYNLVRWQSYLHVSRHSLSFFQNEFSGRICTKVWSARQANGDVRTTLLGRVGSDRKRVE